MLEKKGCIYQTINSKLSLYRSIEELVLEIVKMDNNFYILIQDKAKIIKSYNSKADITNKKKKIFKQKWIRLLFLSIKEVDNNSDNKDKPPTQKKHMVSLKDENKSIGDGDNIVGEKPQQFL